MAFFLPLRLNPPRGTSNGYSGIPSAEVCLLNKSERIVDEMSLYSASRGVSIDKR